MFYLVTSSLGFKSRVGSELFALILLVLKVRCHAQKNLFDMLANKCCCEIMSIQQVIILLSPLYFYMSSKFD